MTVWVNSPRPISNLNRTSQYEQSWAGRLVLPAQDFHLDCNSSAKVLSHALELKPEGELDRAWAADLVQRIETTIRAARAQAVVQCRRRVAEERTS